jgi:uncharacterized radical SAM protein YgiQ
MPFLPVTEEELGGNPADFVLITPEAYVDHPSFGHAIISRLIENAGFSVAVLPQPLCDKDYTRFGKPNVAFCVSGGVVDSMVNNYTVAKRRRDSDCYSEDGRTGMRPDRAVTVYSRAVRRLYPDAAVIIGGIEASLRRMAHYDYWSDRVMPSILVDSRADLLMYGMGEKEWWDILEMLKRGIPVKKIKDVAGTAYLSSFENLSPKIKEQIESGAIISCPSFEEVEADKTAFVKAFRIQYENSNYLSGTSICQKHGKEYVVQNAPARPLTTEEMDRVYALPYMREAHPMYKGKIPAFDEVRFSITSHRGCFGNCSYCALSYHQGRSVSKRSKESIVSEATELTELKDFKGYISDIGGPTANFRNPSCEKQLKYGICKDRQCIGYEKCPNLIVDHTDYLDVLRAVRALPRVKKVFIRSGVRFDYVMYDKNGEFFDELLEYHVSGQLKVAPEHCCDEVLKLMNKPPFSVYREFAARYAEKNGELNKKQYLVPYLISSHPGCTVPDAVKLTDYLKSIGYMPEQAQDFYPTPATKSTCMFYTGIDPDTGEKIYIPRSAGEKRLQRALLQYRLEKNKPIIDAAMKKYGAGNEFSENRGEKAARNARNRFGKSKNKE